MKNQTHLRAWLAENGVTQTQFAAMIGVDQGTVSSWVNARKVPGHKYALAIQAHTGLALEHILIPIVGDAAVPPLAERVDCPTAGIAAGE